MPDRNGCALYFAFANTRGHINNSVRPIRRLELAARKIQQRDSTYYLSTAGGCQPASQPAQQAQAGQQLMNPAPTMTYETAGPQHIEVEQFDGFGPMGTASLGEW